MRTCLLLNNSTPIFKELEQKRSDYHTKLPENLTVNGEFWCGKNALPLKIPASAKIKGEIHD